MIFSASQKKQSIGDKLLAISLSSGFTFVETLVAIAILLIAIVAPLSLVYQSLAASRVARNQVTAIYLAQEAIEFIRATRDDNALSGSAWLSGLSDCATVDGCTIDVPANVIKSCSGQCALLKYNGETFLYGYESSPDWIDTVFRRTITIEDVQAGLETKITASVVWYEGANPRTVTLGENIFNWQ